LDDTLQRGVPTAVLDIGTGSGVLALGALTLGVQRAVGTDIDVDALTAADENARLNGLEDRLQLVRGGPEAASGTWPLVLANILAASLVEMAPILVRRVGHHGHVVLSGFPDSIAPEVERAYRRLGMRQVDLRSRAGWAALALQASW
jgi:ribosomal protein L11 methyltransferase